MDYIEKHKGAPYTNPMDTSMDTIDTLAQPPFIGVPIALRDVVNGNGKLDRRLYGCRWDILSVLMPYELHPSYPALQCLPDDDFPGINLQVRVLRVFKPPSLVYGEYRWHVADNQETFGTGGLSEDVGAQLIADGVGVPVGPAQQVLEAIRGRLGRRLLPLANYSSAPPR